MAVLQFPAMARIDPAALPNRVREHREAAGYTLRDLSAKIGLAHGSLHRIETGVRELNQYWMERLSEVLGVPLADFLHPWQGGLTADERALIDAYRAMDSAGRRMIHAAADAHATPAIVEPEPEPERLRA